MNLMDLFYPPFVLPKAIRSIVHKIGFSGQPRYTPPAKPPKEERDPNRLTATEEKVLKILKRKATPLTSRELGPLIKMSDNHCGIVLTSLYKKGKLDRVRYQKPGTRFYKYTVKEDDAS